MVLRGCSIYLWSWVMCVLCGVFLTQELKYENRGCLWGFFLWLAFPPPPSFFGGVSWWTMGTKANTVTVDHTLNPYAQ